MKKYIFKMAALLIFASVALSSCSVQYRESHRRHDGDRGEHRGHDRDHDHNYHN